MLAKLLTKCVRCFIHTENNAPAAVSYLSFSLRPGRSPDRGRGLVEGSYEPISPPQGYSGLDKQEASMLQSQRREHELPEQR